MRRFVYEDKEWDAKVTLDISEEMFDYILSKYGRRRLFDVIQHVALYTVENGERKGGV